jgi:hypothetical protein
MGFQCADTSSHNAAFAPRASSGGRPWKQPHSPMPMGAITDVIFGKKDHSSRIICEDCAP